MLLVFLEQEPLHLFVTSKRPNAKNTQPYFISEVLNLIFHSKGKLEPLRGTYRGPVGQGIV